AGETCGANLTTDKPVQIRVDGDQSGLDFVSGYTVNLADFQSVSEEEDVTAGKGLSRSPTRQVETVR
ncbi:MAG TPA: hypothetical protein DCS21_10445, partial [Gammaproteobacteria bacterium]|nr:hypothetical protein [Gammaproteobacteria bacterium]